MFSLFQPFREYLELPLGQPGFMFFTCIWRRSLHSRVAQRTSGMPRDLPLSLEFSPLHHRGLPYCVLCIRVAF